MPALNRIRPEHESIGDPCRTCGAAARLHRYRPEHNYMGTGDRCEICNVGIERHRDYRDRRGRKRKSGTHEKPSKIFLGIDGEGQGRRPHRYVLLAASDSTGEHSFVIEDPEGLSTERCLDFILELPLNSSVFGYGLGYDLTKILEGLPNETLYYLFRPELRQRKGKWKQLGPKAVKWKGFALNLQGTKFSIRKGSRRRVIWDIWKFYQGRFTRALDLWKVLPKEEIEAMQYMKDHRSEFDVFDPHQVREYCLSECRSMASLAEKLVSAHQAVELELKAFYGAGSSASAMLDKMGIKEQIRDPPPEMREAVSSAFFGGRFENSIVGRIEGTVYNHDISSAYPYQLCFLPCLIHGKWSHTKRRKDLERCRTGLIRYSLGKPRIPLNWGPFPFREKTGAISYPESSGGGWCWLPEYLSGDRGFKHVQFEEAWVLHSDCDCQPFSKIPEYYCERCRLGKEGPGIVLKLGCNSCYGKLAQSIGNGVFNSWVWAGLITAGCRAQILDVLLLHKDWSNLLMVATDGIYTKEKLDMPIPLPTGTDETGKPLGGWEKKVYENGMFAARPGIYFPLKPSANDLESVRARGIGKSTMVSNIQTILDAWETKRGETFEIGNMERFCGAKSSISKSEAGFSRSHDYGTWYKRPTMLSFDPMPKRECILDDGTLKMRSQYSKNEDKAMPLKRMSMPYRKAMKSKDGEEMRMLEMISEEQPDLEVKAYG